MRLDLEQTTKVLVFSDLHIGDPRLHSSALQIIWKEVQQEKPDLLVLDGDVLEGRLSTEEQRAKLSSICNLVTLVVVLQGNHDTKATKRFADSIKAKWAKQLTGISGDKTFAIEHGNRFDSLWKRFPGVGRLSIWLNRILYRITEFDLQEWIRSFKGAEKRLLKQHKKAQEAWRGKDIVVTGHTHLPTNDPEGIGYFNSGDWIYHRTCVIIDSGKARLVVSKEGPS